MRSVRVSSRITPELKSALEKCAKDAARSESQIIDLAIKQYLSKKREQK